MTNYAGLQTLTDFKERLDARYALKSDISNYTIQKKTTADAGYAASYVLKKGETIVGDTINIPKDYLVKSADVKTASSNDTPVAGLKTGDKYIDFTINAKDDDGEESHLYIPLSDLITPVKGSDAIDVDSTNKISVKIDSDNANGLSVGTNGLQLAAATTTTPGAMTASDKKKVDSALTTADFKEITDDELDEIFGD